MKLIFRFMKKYWYMALLASAFMIGEVYIDLLQPRMMAEIVNEGILGLSNGGKSDLNLVINTGICMMLVVIGGGLCGLLSAVFTGEKIISTGTAFNAAANPPI